MNRPAMGFVMAACLATVPAMAQGDDAQTRAIALRATTCQSCHGEQGNSSSRDVPRLNGQQADCIVKRLRSLRNMTQESPRAIHAMGNVTPQLGGAIDAAIARYYASQSPTQPRPGALARQGEQIYRTGVGKIHVSCQGCHGTRGEGLGTVPRLAGQHAEYLTVQLQAFGMAARISDTMNHSAWSLTEDQIKALTAYLAGD